MPQTECAPARLTLPDLTDPCWADPEWRTRQYRLLIDKNVVSYDEIVLVTSVEKRTAWNWKSGYANQEIKKPYLLAIMLYVNVREGVAA